jgi:hypothetical protein
MVARPGTELAKGARRGYRSRAEEQASKDRRGGGRHYSRSFERRDALANARVGVGFGRAIDRIALRHE